MQQYLRIPIIDRKNALVYPSIEKVVRNIKFIPGTSVPAERLFSKTDELVSVRKKNRLKPKHVNSILFKINTCN